MSLQAEAINAAFGTAAQPRPVPGRAGSSVGRSRGLRYSKGIGGRGRQRFTPAQIARLEKQFDFHPGLAGLKDQLIPPP